MNGGDRRSSDPAAAGAVPRHRVDDILRRAHVELSPSAAAKARGRTGLGLPEPLATTTVTKLTGWAALGASGKAGVLASMVLLGAGIGIGYGLGRAEPRGAAASLAAGQPVASSVPARVEAVKVVPPQRDLESPRAPRDDAGGPVVEKMAEAARAGERKASLTPRRRSGAAPAARIHAVQDERAGPSRDGEELALMRRIERALRADRPALALALLAEVEARFPHSVLEEERLAASVMARCGLRDPGHEQRARSFLQDRPRSVYRTRVTDACGAAGVPAANDHRAASDDGKPPAGDQRRSKE